jgi:hypothetical protein
MRNLSQRDRNRQAKAGESDRAIKTKMVRAAASLRAWGACAHVLRAAQALVRGQAEGREDGPPLRAWMCVCVCMLYHFAVLSTLVFWLLLEEDDVDGVVDALEQQLGVVAHDLALLGGFECADERLDCIHSAYHGERAV